MGIGQYQVPWQLWLLTTDSMLVFSTVLLLNILALTSHLAITVISLEKQDFAKFLNAKDHQPEVRNENHI